MEATKEHVLQNDVRVALAQAGCIVFRANVGKVKMDNGRWFDTQLPPGFPDLFGMTFHDNRMFFIEMKTETGRPREDQIKFHRMLTERGAIHGIARNRDDALRIVNERLVGYGFEKYDK